MNKETLRKTGAILLCVVAVITIMGGIFGGADKKNYREMGNRSRKKRYESLRVL